MKSINYSVIRAICALILGLIMVIWPGDVANYLVITIGVLFLMPGLVGIIGYFASRRDTRNRFPIEGIGSLLFGLWLVFFPGSVVKFLMYILGFVLFLGGIHQLYTLILTRKWTRVPKAFYITPILILAASVVIVFSPRESQETVFIIIGITSIVYALSELLNYFRFINRKSLPRKSTDVVDVEIIE